MPSEPSSSIVLDAAEIVAVPTQPPVRVIPGTAQPRDAALLVMLGEASDEAAAALRVIRHRLEQRRAAGMWVFGVTSARDGEGKSTFATQLALVLGESQRARVLLVEADFRTPSLAEVLGFEVPDGLGFSAQIARRMLGTAEQWVVIALGPSLHVLAEPQGAGFPESLHSTHFQGAISLLARGYDFVVVDSPAILGSGDANVVEEAVDGVIIVTRSKHSKGSELREATKRLGDRKVVGAVIWDADVPQVRRP
jgi:Mrp family chromosome partitioning ATPase